MGELEERQHTGRRRGPRPVSLAPGEMIIPARMAAELRHDVDGRHVARGRGDTRQIDQDPDATGEG